MGKVKNPKYPTQIQIEFLLHTANEQYTSYATQIQLEGEMLTYEHLKEKFEQFLSENKINYEAYMFLNNEQEDSMDIISNTFSMEVSKVVQMYGLPLYVFIKSYAVYLHDLFQTQLSSLMDRIAHLEQKLSKQQEGVQACSPQLVQGISIAPSQNQQYRDLDIGVLFSEPIFDEVRKKEANYPVDFRSEIQRLHIALNSSFKPQITLKCEIGTKENLRHLIRMKPKILHIICHGSQEGSLELEDDSRTVLGTLNTFKAESIREMLKQLSQNLPELVFVNSCYSEKIGQIFNEAGVKHVIMIDSKDTILDQAAQIFSENFYRNIFRGQKIGLAFKEAKESVLLKHNSFRCCCNHSSKQVHKQNCRWKNTICKTIGDIQGHKLYHIPSEKCSCGDMRNFNKHKLKCQWAKQSLFQINNDFRILSESGQQHFPKVMKELRHYKPKSNSEPVLIICCCYHFQKGADGEEELKIPHSESSKFKMLPIEEEKTDNLYKITGSNYRSQIIDYTAPQLLEIHQKVQNSCVPGRQQELYEFMKCIRQLSLPIFVLYGQSGVGKTSFSIKTATYLVERRAYELYFFIDLYDIKDKDMFRYKFNQATKFNYSNNVVKLAEVKNKMIIIIFDNADEFLLTSTSEFYKELNILKAQLHKAKFIITLKSETNSSLEPEKLDCQVRQLDILKEDVAAKLLYSKIRAKLDISVEYSDIYGLILSKPQLRVPKIIENMHHSFSTLKSKLKKSDLQKKMKEIGDGDVAFSKLIQQNLSILRGRSQQSYQILIFISQFSQGVDKNDFAMLSNYQRKAKIVEIPIDKNWKKCFRILFEKYNAVDYNAVDSSKVDEDQLSLRPQINFSKSISMPEPNESVDGQSIFGEGERRESYFLEQLSGNKFIVKRFIRDFIWNKHKSKQNYYMKFIFVAYMAVMLEVYFKWLADEYFIYEELLENSQVSTMGFFSYKDNNYEPPNLTASLKLTNEFHSEFEKLLKQPGIRQKIRSCDPSVFILGHKLDFLHIYSYDWRKVYDYIATERSKEKRIFLTYLQKLIVLIPTALKIANAEESLIQYAISKSVPLLHQIKDFSEPGIILMLSLKLKLMKVTESELEKEGSLMIEEIEQTNTFDQVYLQKVDKDLLYGVKTQWKYEIEYLRIYRQFIFTKNLRKSGDMALKTILERLRQTKEKIQLWLGQEQDWNRNVICQILNNKRKLLIAMIYYNFLISSQKHSANQSLIKFKNACLDKVSQYAEKSGQFFKSANKMKLSLKAKLLCISIYWDQVGRNKPKDTQVGGPNSVKLQQIQNKIKECQAIYDDKRYKLSGYALFDQMIKKLKKQTKQKMWEQSLNSIIFMKALPMSNSSSKTPIIENVIRRKNEFRKQIQKIMIQSRIDVCTKFQILNKEKLHEETKNGCSILLLSTNTRIRNHKACLIFEGEEINEVEVEINQNFIQDFSLNKVRFLILIGNNAEFAIRQLQKLIKNPPTMVSIQNLESLKASNDFQQFQQIRYEDLVSHNDDLREYISKYNFVAKTQIQYIKEFFKVLMKKSEKRLQISDINDLIRKGSTQIQQNLQIVIRDQKRTVVEMKEGTYKDVSPGYRKTHNIYLQTRINNFAVFQKWKQITHIFKQLKTHREEPKYINIFGQMGTGKTVFIEELARLFIQRQMFENGVYIIRGKEVEEKYEGDFENYIQKKSESGNIFNAQGFSKYANADFMLIIDDFHLIKPKANGRYQVFLKKIKEKKINLIFVTSQKQIKDKNQLFEGMKSFRIYRLTDFQLKVLAFNILDLSNKELMAEFNLLQASKEFNIYQIIDLRNKYQGSPIQVGIGMLKSSFWADQDLKKIISSRN